MPAAGEGDVGLFALAGPTYLDTLASWAAAAPRGTGSGERNFLPFIPWLAQRSPVVTIPASNPMEAIGINTPADLELVADDLRRQLPADR